MEQDYNFWRDLFNTYQSLPDFLKFVWVVAPSLLLLAAGRRVAKLIELAIVGHRPPEVSPSLMEVLDAMPESKMVLRVRHDEHGMFYLEQVKDMPQLKAENDEWLGRLGRE